MAPPRRSPAAMATALLLFATIALGSFGILTLLVTVGGGIESAWAGAPLPLPYISQLALTLSRLTVGGYLPILAIAVSLHVVLLALFLWVGRTPSGLVGVAAASAVLLSVQLITLVWLALSFMLPLLP